MTPLTFTKVERGLYATPDGQWAVVADGYTPVKSAGREGDYEGFTGGEWAVVYDDLGRLRSDPSAGQNLDWRPSMTEAKAAAQRLAARKLS